MFEHIEMPELDSDLQTRLQEAVAKYDAAVMRDAGKGLVSLSALNSVGVVLLEAGQPEVALPLFSQVVEGTRAMPGLEARELLEAASSNVASAAISAGHFEEAERELALRVEPDDRGMPTTGSLEERGQWGIVLMESGRAELAAELFEAVAADCIDLEGEQAVITLRTLANLAAARIAAGKTSEALSPLKAAFEGFAEVEGFEHPDTIRAALQAAECLLELDKPREAWEVLNQELPLADRCLGPHHELYVDLLIAAFRASAALRFSSTTMSMAERVWSAARQLPASDAARRDAAEKIWVTLSRPVRVPIQEGLSIVSAEDGWRVVELVGQFAEGYTDGLCVGMKAATVRGLRAALSAEDVEWATADRSLEVSGSEERLELLFRPKHDEFEATVVLEDEALARFRDAVGQRPNRDLRRPRVESAQPARNAPCPCGSGKKYKKCCGAD